jgi:hypothetical protein
MLTLGLTLWNAPPLAQEPDPEPTEVPANTVAPVIIGNPVVGQTLSVTNGTWTNTPSSYAYKWYADEVEIEGETGSTLALIEDYIDAEITAGVVATNVVGASEEAISDPVGPVEAAPDLEMIVLSNLDEGWESGDNPPNWKSTYNGPYYDPEDGTGSQIRARWQLDEGGWTVTDWVPWDIAAVTGGIEWDFLADGSTDAGGAFEVQEQPGLDIGLPSEQIGEWSASWTDTLDSPDPETATEWHTTNGVNKRSNLTVGGTGNLQVTGASGFNNAPISVRATQHRTGKRQFQITLTTTGSSQFWIVVDDGTDNYNDSNWSIPGKDGATGVAIKIPGSSDAAFIYKGGALHETTGTIGGTTNGDIWTVEFDTVAGTASFFRNGTQVGATVTGLSLSNWYASIGFEGTDVAVALFGPGQSRTLSSGYVPYDNL